MASIKLLLFIMVCAAVAAQARGCFASCPKPKYKSCYGLQKPCPSGCPERCYVNCRRCKARCYKDYSASNLSAACEKPGAVCHDPRFVGGDGSVFYFHGKLDRDYCLVSDPDLHINAHFMGKSATQEQDQLIGIFKQEHDLTWVKSIGMRLGSHEIFVGAKKVGRWEDGVEQLSLVVDGRSVLLPPRKGALWEDRLSPVKVKITRVLNVNAVKLRVTDLLSLTAWVVPVTAEESRVHGFDITEEDCFAHLQLSFNFSKLSPHVTGVLGQTYSAGFESPVEVGAVLEGADDKFAVSRLFATDCDVAIFGKQK